jgi:hypothetical protein
MLASASICARSSFDVAELEIENPSLRLDHQSQWVLVEVCAFRVALGTICGSHACPSSMISSKVRRAGRTPPRRSAGRPTCWVVLAISRRSSLREHSSCRSTTSCASPPTTSSWTAGWASLATRSWRTTPFGRRSTPTAPVRQRRRAMCHAAVLSRCVADVFGSSCRGLNVCGDEDFADEVRCAIRP